MALSASMFLFEIVVEEVKSYIECHQFFIMTQFADVFTLNLKDPNDQKPLKTAETKPKKKIKVRNQKALRPKSPTEGKVQRGQSTLFSSPINTLITTMKNFPIELSFYDKNDTDNKLGSTQVPWSPICIDYLSQINEKQDAASTNVKGRYHVYDDITSRRIATIRLNVKLSHIKEKCTSSISSLVSNKKSFSYTKCSSRSSSILSTIKETPTRLMEGTGIIKTIYSGGKSKIKVSNKLRTNKKKIKQPTLIAEESKPNLPPVEIQQDNVEEISKVKRSRIILIKSDTDLNKSKQIEVIRTNSYSFMNHTQFNLQNYIYGDYNVPIRNQVLCVGYFTVENDFDKESPRSTSSKSSPATSPSKDSFKTAPSSGTGREKPMGRFKFNVCDKDCPSSPCHDSMCSIDLPEDVSGSIAVTKCKTVKCEENERTVPTVPDRTILLDLANLKQDCCDVPQTVEGVVGGMQAKMKYDKDSCFCTCECTFGFVKRTTYCGVCGGYEGVGDDLPRKPLNAPFPCPVYHKLIDKNKQKPVSASGSDKSRKCDDSQRGSKKGSKSPSVSTKSAGAANESSMDMGKARRRQQKDDRFKFNYGYTAPKIGHGECGMPCTGTLGQVPKNMGWLWTAEDVPGMKFRPMWKPGATHKHVVRLLKMAKNPGIIMAKKKKKDIGKKKRPLKRPLLTVAKKDGEYTVTLETMKIYPKQRTLNQHPYEDKPVLTYTIGRTEEENRVRQKKKEREQRRLERDQRAFIQSAFSDMCKEICLKTYQQALGLLPGSEDPDCQCYPKNPTAEQANLDISCSCSEDSRSIGSDTDSDEWIVEFTPPNATFDPTHKGKKIAKVDNTSQYSYLDFRVKVLDRNGNQVPRFFKGPDGKTQCSDLGGFWSPDHKWLEINIEGYIGPDGRWAPVAFIGPHGEQVDCDSGKFQLADGSWLIVGVDGYVDNTGKWKYYPKPRGTATTKKRSVTNRKKGAGDKKDDKGLQYKPSETTWSCFGDVDPKYLSELGILGHGQDKKLLLKTLQEMLNHGEDVKIPVPSTVPRIASSKKGKGKSVKHNLDVGYYLDNIPCKHPVPSSKGVVATDARGHKTYFKLKDFKNFRPKQRLANLAHQGISLSSFHAPCFRSFINTEIMKKQQYERIMNMALRASDSDGKHVSTQHDYRYIV